MKKLNELKQERAKIYEQMNTITELKGEELTDEKRSEWKEKYEKVQRMSEDIKMYEEQERFNQSVTRNEFDGEQKELDNLNKRFDISKAFREIGMEQRLTGVEKELNDKYAEGWKSTRKGNAIYLPVKRAAGTSLTATAGSNFTHTIQDENVSIIGASSLMKELGVKVVTGLNGSFDLPYHAGLTASFKGEGTNLSEASVSPLKKTLTGRRIGTFKEFNNEYLAQTSPEIHQDIMDELRVAIDRGLMTEGYKVITGNTSATFSGSTSLTWKNMTDLEAAVYADTLNVKSYVTTPTLTSSLKSTIKSGSTFGFIMDGSEVNGYKAYGTDLCVANNIIFGDFSYLWVGIWGNAVEVLVNPFSLDVSGQTRVTVSSMADLETRNPNAFAYGSITS